MSYIMSLSCTNPSMLILLRLRNPMIWLPILLRLHYQSLLLTYSALTLLTSSFLRYSKHILKILILILPYSILKIFFCLTPSVSPDSGIPHINDSALFFPTTYHLLIHYIIYWFIVLINCFHCQNVIYVGAVPLVCFVHRWIPSPRSVPGI